MALKRPVEPYTWTVALAEPNETVTAVFDPAPNSVTDAIIVFGHGASSNLSTNTVVSLCEQLRASGLHTVRYNFLYSERKKGPPDRMPKLMLCLQAVAQSVRETFAPSLLLAGGHSMGGRTASMFAAERPDAFDGLILCGYPLHPAGQPEKLRSAHLPDIRVPVLCVNGTRDDLCTRDIMDPIVAALPLWQMHWLDPADHGFHVKKSSGRTDEDVRDEFGQAVRIWLASTLGAPILQRH